MEEISAEQMQGYVDTAVDMAIGYGPRVVLALAVLVVGLWLINRVVAMTRRALESRDIEVTLSRFLTNLVSVLLKVLLIISTASMIGIATTSFIALLGAVQIGLYWTF